MCAYTTFGFLMTFLISHCVTVDRYEQPDIISKTKVEIADIEVSAKLGDLVVISAPIVKGARYYLHNPNGDAIRLNLSNPFYKPKDDMLNNLYEDIVVKYSNNIKAIYPVNNNFVFDLESRYFDTDDIFGEHSVRKNANDFIIGPLREDDHGNWVVSAYKQDDDGDWTEIFQVVTIEITEYIPPKPRIATLEQGDTFSISFAYPIPDLTSCELTAPKSTFDRMYSRDGIKMAECGYVIENVTKEDQGAWRIVAVGKIVYRTQLYLTVNEKSGLEIT